MSAPDLTPANDAVLRLPGTLLSEIESMAEDKHTDTTSILCRAIRGLRVRQFVQEVESLRAAAPASDYTEADVEQLVDEVRSELHRARSL